MNFRLPTLIISVLILAMLLYASFGDPFTAIFVTMFGSFFIVGIQVYFILNSEEVEEDSTIPINLPSNDL